MREDTLAVVAAEGHSQFTTWAISRWAEGAVTAQKLHAINLGESESLVMAGRSFDAFFQEMSG